ncbi:MAG: hypothetical protein AAF968_00960 [Pseudomonadota bacterium]
MSGGLDLTRRGFLVASSASVLAGAGVILPGRSYSELRVLTRYSDDRLTEVTLLLTAPAREDAAAHSLSMVLEPRSFAPLSQPGVVSGPGFGHEPRIELLGVDAAARDDTGAIRPTARPRVRIEGIDLFIHRTGIDGRPIYYTFELFLRTGDPGWRTRLETNAWLHGRRRTTLTFPVTARKDAEPNGVYLAEVMQGSAAYENILGSGWISATMGGIARADFEARGEFVARLATQPSLPQAEEEASATPNPAVARPAPLAWRWSLAPNPRTGGRIAFEEGGFGFQRAAFGWRWPRPAPTDGDGEVPNTDDGPATAPEPVFDIPLGSARLGDQTLTMPPVDLKGAAAEGTRLTLTVAGTEAAEAGNVTGRLVTSFRAQGAREVALALAGRFDLQVESGGRPRARVRLTVPDAAPEPLPDGTSASSSSDGVPLFGLVRVAPRDSLELVVSPLTEARLLPLPDTAAAPGTQNRPAAAAIAESALGLPDLAPTETEHRILTTGFGTLSLRDDKVALALAGRRRRLVGFMAEVSVETLPVGLASRDGPIHALLRRDVGIAAEAPLLRLDGVAMIGVSPSREAQNGWISIDGPAGIGRSGKAGLDVPLDPVGLTVRRAADHLALDFRFAGLRLTSAGGGDAGANVYEAPALDAEAVTPVDRPARPLLVVGLPPQHVAEEAYLRRENSGSALPAVPFIELAHALDGPNEAAEVLARFERLRSQADRGAKRQEREALRELAIGWIERGAELSEIDDTYLALLTRYRDFAEDYPSFDGISALPMDQQVYIGPEDLDPDAAAIAWNELDKAEAAGAPARLEARLRAVEAWDPLDPEADSATDPVVRRAFLKLLNPPQNDGSVLDSVLSFSKHVEAQTRLTALKERVAPDYAAFRAFFAERVTESAALSEEDRQPLSRFVSTVWARRTPVVDQIYFAALRAYADPTGAGLDPFRERTRARFSGPSRLVFEWRRVVDAGPAGPRPFVLEELLDWRDREMAVPRRARALRDIDHTDNPGRGRRARNGDNAEMLRYQGIAPATNPSSDTRMAEVYAHAAVAPSAFETSIELPFRLMLSPAQDARWSQPQRVPEGVIDGALEDWERPGELPVPLWTASLSTDLPDPALRAVWSSDFAPESFLAKSGRSRNPSDTRLEKRLNRLFDGAPRGTAAPWLRRRLRPVEGGLDWVEGTLGIEDAALLGRAGTFRASLDAYDRDQIVKLTSVYGLPVSGGRDPATLELRKDADAFDPPEGYALVDLVQVDLADIGLYKAGLEDGEQAGGEGEATSEDVPLRRDLSAIYKPRTLKFRELTLSALGGTLDLDTEFQPPAPASTLRQEPLFDAFTVERWRHRAIVGRDWKVEVVYRGYLFPFGNRAALVKITERKFRQPPKGAKGNSRGPTAYLVQRLFIRVAQPEKRSWYDQPDEGRGWPCDRLRILTTETPDLVDPLPAAPFTAKEDLKVIERANGRLALGPKGRGLVFWPRTAPFRSAEFAFEFEIDGSGQKLSMPLVFVDNEAAHDQETLATLTDYYNGIDPGAATGLGGSPDAALRQFYGVAGTPGQDAYVPQIDLRSRRVVAHRGEPRAYAPERSDGDTRYETLAWVIGAEGRPGNGIGNALGDATPGGQLRVARASAIRSLRSNHYFGPLLVIDDQPPFYPFVQLALIRLDRVARLIGERRGREALVAFDARYLRAGLADPEGGPDPDETGMEVVLDVLSPVVLDAGNKGDRVGAVGRPSGRVAILARREGPVTLAKLSADDLNLLVADDALGAPPKFSNTFQPPEANPSDGRDAWADGTRFASLGLSAVPGAFATPALGFAQSGAGAAAANDKIKKIIELIFGDSDQKFLGVFKWTELISIVLCSLAENSPLLRETIDYVGKAEAEIVAVARRIAADLAARIAALEESFREASLDAGDTALELRRVYPSLGTALTTLSNAVAAVERETDGAALVRHVGELPGAGKGVVRALDEVARDPISPLKIELKRLFGERLAEIDAIRREMERLLELGRDVAAALGDDGQRQAIEFVSKSMLDHATEVAAALVALAPASRDGTSEKLRALLDGLEELLLAVAQDARGAILLGKTTFEDVAAAARAWSAEQAFREAIARNDVLAVLDGAYEDALDELEAELRPYWARLKALRDEAQRLDEAIKRAGDEISEIEGRIAELEILLAANKSELLRRQLDHQRALKAQAERLRARAEAELNLHADRLVEAALGISRPALRARVDAVDGAFRAFRDEPEPLDKAQHLLTILSEVDTVFFQGAYRAEAEAAFTEANVALIARTVDVLDVVLETAASFVDGVAPPDDALAYLRDVPGHIEAFAEAVLPAADADALTEAVADLEGTLLARASPAAKRWIEPWTGGLARLARADKAYRALDLPQDLIDEHEVIRLIRDLPQYVLRPSAVAFRSVADAAVRADIAFAAFAARLEASRAQVRALRAQGTISPDDVKALVRDFPGEEAMQVLEAWPRLVRDVARAVADLETDYLETAELLRADVIEDLEQVADLGDAEAEIAAAGARVVADLDTLALRLLGGLARRASAEVGRFVEAVRPPDLNAPAPLRRVVALARGLRRQLADLVARHPFLRPAVEELDRFVDTLEEPPTAAIADEIEKQAVAIESAVRELENATTLSGLIKAIGEGRKEVSGFVSEDRFTFAKELVEAWLDRLALQGDAVGSAANNAATNELRRLRGLALAQAASALAALRQEAASLLAEAYEGALAAIFADGLLDGGAAVYATMTSARTEMLEKLDPADAGNDSFAAIAEIARVAAGRPRHMLLAVANPARPAPEIAAVKAALLEANATKPHDQLYAEAGWIEVLNGRGGGGTTRRTALSGLLASFRTGPAAIQIVGNVRTVFEQLLRADISGLVDFGVVRDAIEAEIRQLVPQRVTTRFDFDAPVGSFPPDAGDKAIFQPTGPGRFTIVSENTVDLSNVTSGGPREAGLEASATAVMSPFAIRLLGGFEAITIYFSGARMAWSAGSDPTFEIDFVDYEIGKELDFVQELAASLTASAGGAYIKPALGLLGIEAGYRLNIGAINLGGVTFMNVGLSAFAVLPFEKRKAEFGAGLSSRASPFVIIAGIWGGGGHFSLRSDGRRITAFDASFVFGGGGAIAYGPLQLMGFVNVGVFVRKAGSYTEISGDFFAGGSGRVAIFSICASLTVTIGMDGGGNMTGSAVFRFSFSISFAKIRFAITLFKQEGKNFSSAGAEQAALEWRVAEKGENRSIVGPDEPVPGWSRRAAIVVNTSRQDQSYERWTGYFSEARSMELI